MASRAINVVANSVFLFFSRSIVGYVILIVIIIIAPNTTHNTVLFYPLFRSHSHFRDKFINHHDYDNFDTTGTALSSGVTTDEDDESTLRPPLVTITGHVDHGKTSLRDARHNTKVTATDAIALTADNVIPVDLGGGVSRSDVSAKDTINWEDWLSEIMLPAERQELKADYDGDAVGIVVEAKMEKKGLGAVATT